MASLGAPSPALRAYRVGHDFARERQQVAVALSAILVLMPLWAVMDRYLAPEFASRILTWRLGAAATCLPALAIVLRTRRLPVVRATGAFEIALAGVILAFIFPHVTRHASIFTLGFSLVFWGAAVILSWPLPCTLFTFGVVLLAFLWREAPASRGDPGELAGNFFYLGSAAFIGGMIIEVRRRLDERAMRMAFELQHSNQQLQVALDRLRDAQARLVVAEKLGALGRLLAGLSHEINNPLGVIHANLDPIERYVGDLQAVVDVGRARDAEIDRAARERDLDFVRDDLPEALAIVRGATDRIRAIHTDLRAFIRGDAPEQTETDLNDGLRATVAMMRRSLPDAVRIEAVYGDLPRLRAQPGQLNQVFFNLLTNAVDAVDGAGTITVRTSVAGDAVQVEVIDSGPGVPEPVRARLFEPFFTTKGVGKGTGLGLATCYQIARNHDGTLELDPSHHPGARFVVTLPLTRAA